MKTPGVSSETFGHVRWLELNDEKNLNALTTGILTDLKKKLEDAEKDDSVRLIFLTGKGRAFCAGQNLQEVTAENAPMVKELLQKFYAPVIRRIHANQKPVICGVNGAAIGAGFSLVLACDLILMSDKAKLQLGFSKIGLIPDAGATYFLPRSLDRYLVSKMMMLDTPLDAETALRCGLVAEVYKNSEFHESCRNFLQALEKRPIEALKRGKKLLLESPENSLVSQMKLEAEEQAQLTQQPDYIAAVKAFLKK